MSALLAQASSFLEEKDKIRAQYSTLSSRDNNSTSSEEITALQEALATLQVQYTETHEHSEELGQKLSTTNVSHWGGGGGDY